jgi:hypothetical protein
MCAIGTGDLVVLAPDRTHDLLLVHLQEPWRDCSRTSIPA